jgi:hypothetical protein
MELWQRYRTYVASAGMWDVDSGKTHAVEGGYTLCGRVPDTSQGAWEQHRRATASKWNVTCKRCRVSMHKEGRMP